MGQKQGFLLLLLGIVVSGLGVRFFLSLGPTTGVDLKAAGELREDSVADRALKGDAQEPAPEASPPLIVPDGAVEKLSPADQKQIATVESILLSKSDNDPRMDTELRGFSQGVKRALVQKYGAAPAERRNQRGTLVFLLGRELKDPTDIHFFKTVLLEKACLSLQDCNRDPEGHGGAEEHLESVNETTLNYPQLMGLRALAHRGRELKDAGLKDGPLFASILTALKDARDAPNPRVQAEARTILEELEGE